MIEQQKLLRVFQLIKLLKNHRRKSIDQLAAILEISERTVYRYIELLQEVGYLIDQDHDGRPFIFEEQEESEHVLTPEEAKLVNDLLAGAGSHPLTESIRKKLYQTSELASLPDNIIKAHTGMVVRKLAEAIENKKQVILKRYESANSETVSDRLVEPHSLSENYTMLSAYEKSSEKVKVFKVERISGVEQLEESCSYRNNEAPKVPDPFGMAGDEKIQVKLFLSQRAAMLLREEHPLCVPGIYFDKGEGQWVYSGVVKSYKGIGRFILGLPGEIEVRKTEGLRGYLEEVLKQYSWL